MTSHHRDTHHGKNMRTEFKSQKKSNEVVRPSKADASDHQGRQANIEQNTKNTGYQQDR